MHNFRLFTNSVHPIAYQICLIRLYSFRECRRTPERISPTKEKYVGTGNKAHISPHIRKHKCRGNKMRCCGLAGHKGGMIRTRRARLGALHVEQHFLPCLIVPGAHMGTYLNVLVKNARRMSQCIYTNRRLPKNLLQMWRTSWRTSNLVLVPVQVPFFLQSLE